MQSRVDFGSYRLYEAGSVGGPRVVELVSRRKGLWMVKQQQAEAVTDEDGTLLCFWLKAEALPVPRRLGVNPAAAGCGAGDLPAATAFTMVELDAIAGTNFRHGRSRTARMSEEQRAARVKRIYDATGRMVSSEDIVERSTKKLEAWAQIGMLQQQVDLAHA